MVVVSSRHGRNQTLICHIVGCSHAFWMGFGHGGSGGMIYIRRTHGSSHLGDGGPGGVQIVMQTNILDKEELRG